MYGSCVDMDGEICFYVSSSILDYLLGPDFLQIVYVADPFGGRSRPRGRPSSPPGAPGGPWLLWPFRRRARPSVEKVTI